MTFPAQGQEHSASNHVFRLGINPEPSYLAECLQLPAQKNQEIKGVKFFQGSELTCGRGRNFCCFGCQSKLGIDPSLILLLINTLCLIAAATSSLPLSSTMFRSLGQQMLSPLLFQAFLFQTSIRVQKVFFCVHVISFLQIKNSPSHYCMNNFAAITGKITEMSLE